MVSLVIVESPAKIKTVGDILAKLFGKGRYRVLASYGHIRDLPDDALGVDIAAGFRPQYAISDAKKNVVKRLKAALKEADTLYLATDPDREGESIAWHLVQTLRPVCPVKRVIFNALTAEAIKAGFGAARPIDMSLVASQETRRVLDRLVGYKISPILWDHLPDSKGLSAGRVQSAALHLVVQRQRDIDAFQPREYWSVIGRFAAAYGSFEARLHTWHGEPLSADLLSTQTEADDVVQSLKDVSFSISKLEQFPVTIRSPAPFTTATLLQAASTHLPLSPERTMQAAQTLYEAGYVTYVRTDSVAISPEALKAVRHEVVSRFGSQYLAASRAFQHDEIHEAHECIHPTRIEIHQLPVSDAVDDTATALYSLIWKRFAACQMADAVYNQTVVQVAGDENIFCATSRELAFDGFLCVYEYGEDVEPASDSSDVKLEALPILIEGERVQTIEIVPQRYVTQPSNPFSVAGLLHELDIRGVGRPSTFASTVSALSTRGTVTMVDKILVPAEIGVKLNAYLTSHFPGLFNPEFTAEMETRLDEIAAGSQTAPVFLSTFWREFAPLLEAVRGSSLNASVSQAELACPRCHGRLVIRTKKDGSQFVGCAAFPQCRYSRAVDSPTIEGNQEICPRCGKLLIKRSGRQGTFVGCSGFPNCRFTQSVDKV